MPCSPVIVAWSVGVVCAVVVIVSFAIIHRRHRFLPAHHRATAAASANGSA